MCGIGALVGARLPLALVPLWLDALARRGPSLPPRIHLMMPSPSALNGVKSMNVSHVASLEGETEALQVLLLASVLQLRGSSPAPQPLISETSVLCFNGEIFGVNLTHNPSNCVAVLAANITAGMHDGSALHRALDAACAHLSDKDIPSAIMEVLEFVEGPYALVYMHTPSHTLHFARDVIGRRSLLRYANDDHFLLSSVSVGTYKWEEVPPDGLYSVDLSLATAVSKPLLLPWRAGAIVHTSRLSSEPNCVVDWDNLSSTFIQLMRASVRKRTLTPPPSPIALLFSGGVDSALLAFLCGELVGEVDLITVACEKPDGGFDVPDRLLALETCEILQKLLPDAVFRLVCVNATSQLVQSTSAHLAQLLHPADTLMDASIAGPLWFGAQGRGTIDGEEYVTLARILLTGHGADELCGGYVRHLRAFERGGWPAVQAEIDLDVGRIWLRNLGRDDRVISDCGREARHPYLDETFVRWIASLPCWQRCSFGSGPHGSPLPPDKRLIREAAMKVGLVSAASTPKRAIQFGTRSAKLYAPPNAKAHGDAKWAANNSKQ